MGVLTGILITALIQSSSATTVMVVSFVNAGLMTLAQSIGVIMGANIGTTVTAWIISAVGFKVNIAAFAIPLLAIGMPLIFSSKGNRKSIGEFVFGFSFLFMGLSFLQEAATAMNIGDMVAGMLAHVPQDSFLTILLFVIVGAVVTMIGIKVILEHAYDEFARCTTLKVQNDEGLIIGSVNGNVKVHQVPRSW